MAELRAPAASMNMVTCFGQQSDRGDVKFVWVGFKTHYCLYRQYDMQIFIHLLRFWKGFTTRYFDST